MPETTSAVAPSLSSSRLLRRWIWVLLVAMAVCVGRAATSQNENLLDLKRYAQLGEKSPFQERVLMAYPIRAAGESRAFHWIYESLFQKTVASPEDLAVSLINCMCLLGLLPVVEAMRRSLGPPPETTWLAPVMTMMIVALTYVVHFEQRYTMPYDQPSLLLYSVGLLAVVRRQGWLLLLVLAVATPNRETVVFLLPAWMYLLWREGRRLAAVGYSVAGAAIWLGWRMGIAHLLHEGRQAWDLPWKNNLMSLAVPLHWPQLLEVFGFLAIPMWLLRPYVTDRRLRALWVGTIPFLAAALVVGVWRETRIFGELSALAGVTFAVEIEAAVRRRCGMAAGDDAVAASERAMGAGHGPA
jgi:hypothetical protein